MAISFDEFVLATNAEVVGDHIIIGSGPSRRKLGSNMDGVFALTPDGHAVMASLEAGSSKEEAVQAVPAPAAPVVAA